MVKPGIHQAAHRALAALMAVSMTPHRAAAPTAPDGHTSGDRGDVPGWVMITMMTAIVVIVLLGVFQEAVVTAVKNAFDSITGQSATGTP